ncbi:MAG: tetratricopeptide repeat protein, partial [Myxococcales bacterium]|nr:tetratricopeptide repeat protein [Myxococcales bacterium]
AVLGEVGRLATRLEKTERALAAWRRRLSEDSRDREALDAVVTLLAKHERWESLAAALRQRASSGVDGHQRRADLVRIAEIYATRLDRAEAAIDVWNEVEQEFGETVETIESLAKNLTTVTRWGDLASVLQRAAGHETERVADLSCRLGEVFRTRLGQPAQAVDCYEASLRADPVHSGARAGLAALLGSSEAGARAVEVLSELFVKREEWTELAGIVEFRLEVAEGAESKSKVLRETAVLQERHNEDQPAALDYLRRAMGETPLDETLDEELERLTRATSGWETAVAAYRGAVAALGQDAPAKRVIKLRMAEAVLLEQQLARPIEALAAYEEVLKLNVQHAEAVRGAIRMGAAAGNWASVTQAAVPAMIADGEYDESLIALVEAQAGVHGGWNELAAAFGPAAEQAAAANKKLGADLEARLALWHRDRRDAADEARDALVRSLNLEPGHVQRLEMLAALQREEPDRRLVFPEGEEPDGPTLLDTLLNLAGCRGENFDELHEAAELAVAGLGDTPRTRGILRDLLERSAALWNRGVEPSGKRSNAACCGLAIESLARLYLDVGDRAEAAALLSGGGSMPFPAVRAQDMRLRSAALYVGLGNRPAAIDLYQSVLDERPEDLEIMRLLAPLCEAEERFPQLLAVRRRQLTLTPEGDERLALRLDIARIVGIIELRGGRVEALLDNLKEHPGHDDSLAALTTVLTDKGRYLQLTDFVSGHADLLERRGDRARAARLWFQAASLSERELSNVRRALSSHRRVVALEPNLDSLDALARLHVELEEFTDAIPWLEQRLGQTPPGEEHTTIVMRLARAYVGAGKIEHALRTLKRAYAEDPNENQIRDFLSALLREHERWEPLADLLLSSADHITDPGAAESALREAISINLERLNAHDRAVPGLQKLHELRLDDRKVHVQLADALHIAGRLEEARDEFEQLIRSYGRRRSRERAQFHFRLARVYVDEKNREAALAQLDEAARIDRNNSDILVMLADVSRESGDLVRAERAYRALLLAARRDPTRASAGEAQVLYELSRLARERGEAAQAVELLDSAVTQALADESQAKRLQKTLREREDHELLMRILKTRLERVADDEERAQILSDLGLAHELAGERDEGIALRLQAVRLRPNDTAFHQAAREQAQRMNQPERYVEVVSELLANAIKADELSLVIELRLRLADVMERDLEDLDRANALYAEVEASGERVVDAWIGLARVAAARGDRARQVELLEKISELPDDQMSAEARAQTAFGLAELHLAQEDAREAGIAAIRRALAADPRYDIAEPILRRAVANGPEDAELVDLYEEVVRKVGDPRMLLGFLEGRAARDDVRFYVLREAIALADTLADDDKVEQLLSRTVVLAAKRDGATAELVWAYTTQANRRRVAGDLIGAISLVRQAKEAADYGAIFDIALELAQQAVQFEAFAATGVELFEELLDFRPNERRVWQPLMTVYRERGDQEKLERLMDATLETISDPDERVHMRLDVVRGMLADEGREADAVKILRQALEDAPDNPRAQSMLAEVFERTGYDEELAQLLKRQLETAIDGGDDETVVSLTLRLGGLLGKSHPEDARAIFRRSLEVVPTRREIIVGMLDQLAEDADTEERASIMERLLAIEEGDAAVKLALELAELWTSLEDEEAVARVLDCGYKAAPNNEDIRERLDTWYRAHEQWDKLAELIEFAATQETDRPRATELLREAARLYGESLGDAARATEVLRQAYGMASTNLELLRELAAALAATGEHAVAIEELTNAIDWQPMEDASLISFLKLRAEFRGVVGDEAGVVEDLEAAFAKDGDELLDDLLASLERLRDAAATAGDRAKERASTLRIVELQQQKQAPDRAREVLAGWVERAPDDADALRLLLDLDTAAERWDSVATNCALLIGAVSGDDKVAAAERLVDACEKAGDITRARDGLELVYAEVPDSASIRGHLKAIYEKLEINGALARILIQEASSIESKERKFKTLHRAGELLLEEDGDAAAEALKLALEIKPTDQKVNLMLVEAYTAAKNFGEAHKILDTAITAMRGRRSPELSRLQYRKATLARAQDDSDGELRWLKEAYHSDRNNGEVAVELADMAENREDYDLAIRVLRSIALMDAAPISRAMAYLRQGFIADRRGDRQKAVLWGRKALMEDPNCTEATDFLGRIGEL